MTPLDTANDEPSAAAHRQAFLDDRPGKASTNRKWRLQAQVERRRPLADENTAVSLLTRTKLILGSGQTPVIGITAVHQATSTSALTQHLARIAARSGTALLVRDGVTEPDTRRPSLLAAWKHGRSSGDSVRLDPDIAALAYASLSDRSISSLDFSQSAAADMFTALKARFSTVILDAGPVASIDRRYLALCSGIWLAISQHRDLIADAALCTRSLDGAGVNILGAIFLRHTEVLHPDHQLNASP